MKILHNKILLGLIIGLVLYSCGVSNNDKHEDFHCYFEKKLSFYDPSSSQWSDSNFYYTDWIRKPKNIRFVHENFKRIGYQKIIDYGYFWEWNSDHRSIRQRIDSLILTFEFDSIASEYYREFWQRREYEQNSKIVFEVLTDIQIILDNEHLDYDTDFINDTLVNLFQIHFVEDSLDLKLAQNNFDYLVSIGFHQSAYNLLFERYSYYDIAWNREDLLKKLIIDSTCSAYQPWIQDDTK